MLRVPSPASARPAQPAMTAAALADIVVLDDVTAAYDPDRPVIRGLTAGIAAQGLTQVAGGNGTGKSTFVELLSGYLSPIQGTVTVAGQPAGALAARPLRRIVRTTPALFDLLTVRDHLTLFATAYGIPVAGQLERASRLGLAPWFDEHASGLSSGTAKKLWYVMCSGGRPRLVVLDEPFNAVDADGVDTMVDEITAWAADSAVVLVAHTVPARLEVDQVLTLGGPA